jgi:hypothetical protein
VAGMLGWRGWVEELFAILVIKAAVHFAAGFTRELAKAASAPFQTASREISDSTQSQINPVRLSLSEQLLLGCVELARIFP